VTKAGERILASALRAREQFAEVIEDEDGSDLWNADPECKHEVIHAPGGGI